jgi:hypothetical protein
MKPDCSFTQMCRSGTVQTFEVRRGFRLNRFSAIGIGGSVDEEGG